jgi:hypothetical protein
MNTLDCHEGEHHVNKLAHIHQTLNNTLKHKGGKIYIEWVNNTNNGQQFGITIGFAIVGKNSKL